MEGLYSIKLPRKFVQDALDRGLDIGYPFRESKTTIWLSMKPVQIDELRSDAKYYSDPAGRNDFARHLAPAAKRVLVALDKYGL